MNSITGLRQSKKPIELSIVKHLLDLLTNRDEIINDLQEELNNLGIEIGCASTNNDEIIETMHNFLETLKEVNWCMDCRIDLTRHIEALERTIEIYE